MKLYRMNDDLDYDRGHLVVDNIDYIEKCRDVTYYCVVINMSGKEIWLNYNEERIRDGVYDEILDEIQDC